MYKQVLFAIFLVVIVILSGCVGPIQTNDAGSYYCESHNDCIVKGCCPAICINKIYQSAPCPNPDIHCEFSYWPQDQICGCINHTCQGSKELFVKYNEIKEQAMNISLSDTERAMGYCDQLHGEYVFECYTKVASNILSLKELEAIKVCEHITSKYYDGISVENECYSKIALETVVNNPDLAIELCQKASTKRSCNECINYRSRCAQGIAEIIAKTDLTKAFKACDTENIDEDSSYCKFYAIESVEKKYKDDPQSAMGLLVESNICDAANFSGYMSDYYKTECNDLCFIVNARMLAKDGNTEEAIRYCDQSLSEETLYNKNICYNEIAMIIAGYDLNTARSLCDKVPEESINYAPEKCKDALQK